MSLLGEIREENAMRSRMACPVGRALVEFAEKDAAELQSALDDATLTSVAIARVLHKRGYAISLAGKSVGAHRRGACGCRA